MKTELKNTNNGHSENRAACFPVDTIVRPLIVACGLGTNSAALLVGLKERKIRPDYITFADTGGEKPWTYEYIDVLNDWCEFVGFPRITVVCGCYPQQKIDKTLENELLRLQCLPSKALGYSTCSEKWKIAPQNRWAKNMGFVEPTKLIGFDFDEPDRAEKAQPEKGWIKKFPLMEWFWGREECIRAIKKEGIPQPGKSACFFCPSSKKCEILALPKELQQRAIAMEKNAMEGPKRPDKVKGLGRQWSWSKLIDHESRQMSLFDFIDPPPVDCSCYD